MVQLARLCGAAALLSAAATVVFAAVIDQAVVPAVFTSMVIIVAASLLATVRTLWLLTDHHCLQVAMIPVVALGRVSGGQKRSSW